MLSQSSNGSAFGDPEPEDAHDRSRRCEISYSGVTYWLALTQSSGWSVLAEVPGREVVMGAVTQPWEANVIFRGLPPSEFAAFNEPGYVKIAWTLRADPVSPNESIFLTETRTVTTDPSARARFRRYWSFLSPGVIVIRWMTLRAVKTAAERRGYVA